MSPTADVRQGDVGRTGSFALSKPRPLILKLFFFLAFKAEVRQCKEVDFLEHPVSESVVLTVDRIIS